VVIQPQVLVVVAVDIVILVVPLIFLVDQVVQEL
jgi:hypothetical protein